MLEVKRDLSTLYLQHKNSRKVVESAQKCLVYKVHPSPLTIIVPPPTPGLVNHKMCAFVWTPPNPNVWTPPNPNPNPYPNQSTVNNSAPIKAVVSSLHRGSTLRENLAVKSVIQIFTPTLCRT